MSARLVRIARQAPAGTPIAPDDSWVARLLTRLWPCVLMDGGRRCPYLRRWTIHKAHRWSLYVHQFIGDDWSTDRHDHSARFISIGLWGRYLEETDRGTRLWRAPWIRTFPATHAHRLRLVDGRHCWTLALVGRVTRSSGFYVDGQWWPSAVYQGSGRATSHTAC